MIRFYFNSIILILFVLLTSNPLCAENRITVFVSILPQKYFVQQIGKELVGVEVMVQPGASPHTYEPKPFQMVALSTASIYFSVGVTFEKAWLNKIASSNPDLVIVHTDENVEKIPMTAHHHHHDEPGGDHEHHHHNHDIILDPHIWLSPPLVKIQALNILNGLQNIDPANSAIYEANYQEFMSEIDQLHLQLQNTFSGKEGTPFMVFHPSWGYFAKTYGLKQVPIELEGKDPKPSQLMELIKYAREQNIKVIFVQPQFSTRSARLVAKEIEGEVVFIDPLALNWAENLKEASQAFEMIFRAK